MDSRLGLSAWIHSLNSEPGFTVWLQSVTQSLDSGRLDSEPGFQAWTHSLDSDIEFKAWIKTWIQRTVSEPAFEARIQKLTSRFRTYIQSLNSEPLRVWIESLESNCGFRDWIQGQNSKA